MAKKPLSVPPTQYDPETGEPLVRLTLKVLKEGASIHGGFSRQQLILFDPMFAGWPWPEDWRDYIVNKLYRQSLIDKFLSLKNAHVASKNARSQATMRERKRARRTGEEYRFDHDIEQGMARRMINGIETVYRIGPAMTREQIHNRRSERMLRGMVENGTEYVWKGKTALRGGTSHRAQLRRAQRIADGTLVEDPLWGKRGDPRCGKHREKEKS
jgi:hypothetical protein